MKNIISSCSFFAFSFVGTIIDAAPRYAEAFRRAAYNLGLDEPDIHQVQSDIGNYNLKQIIERQYGSRLDEQIRARLTESANRIRHDLLQDPMWQEYIHRDVVDTIINLREQRKVIGLFSGTQQDAVLASLSHHDLSSIFPGNLRVLHTKDDPPNITTAALKSRQLETLVERFAQSCSISEDTVRSQMVVVGHSRADQEASIQQNVPFCDVRSFLREFSNF
jgi:phosphoglycolate phosphatase-like HAD superfamily hydrolase